MEFVRKVQEMMKGIGGRGVEFPRTLTEGDLITAATACVSNKFNQLGAGFTVPAQQEYYVGQTGKNEINSYIYVFLKDASGTELKGKVRIAIYDANDRLKGIVYEEEEEVLHGSVSDRQQKQFLQARPDIVAAKDDKIVMLFKPDSDCTVSNTQSIVLLPVTNRWVPGR